MREGNGCFCSYQSATDDRYALTKFIRMKLCIDRHDHIWQIHSFDRWNQFVGTDRNKQRIRIKLTDIICCYFCIQYNLHAGSLHTPDQYVT